MNFYDESLYSWSVCIGFSVITSLIQLGIQAWLSVEAVCEWVLMALSYETRSHLIQELQQDNHRDFVLVEKRKRPKVKEVKTSTD